MHTRTPAASIRRFGSFELDEAMRELRCDGQVRSLPAQPYRVLVLLIDRSGEIVTRQEIRNHLWGDRKYVEVDRRINFCMNQIRTALRDPAEAARYIKTVPRLGYTFVGPVFTDETPRPGTSMAPAGHQEEEAGQTGVAAMPPEDRVSKTRFMKRRPAALVIILLTACALPLHDSIPPAAPNRMASKIDAPSRAEADVPTLVTTNSREALQRYNQGIEILKTEGDAPSIGFFERALELDPSFAMADAALAARYGNLGQPGHALVFALKAYVLRGHVSERERLLITTRYLRMKGEPEKLTKVLNMWKSEYPRDGSPRGSLGVNYIMLGQFSKAMPELQEALRLSPDDASSYDNLATLYVVLNQPEKAKVLLNAALENHLDTAGLRLLRYEVAFIENDGVQMQRQLDWAAARPGSEDILLSTQSNTEACHGRLTTARSLSFQASESATRATYPESAALWLVNASLREAEFGESRQAVHDAERALARAGGRNVKVIAALSLARAGNPLKATLLVKEIEQYYPTDTMLPVYTVPVIKAAVALSERDPRRAIAILEPVRPYDMARPSPGGMISMYSTFLRGEAYLKLGRTQAANVEFQTLADHPGLMLNSTLAVVGPRELTKTRSLLTRPGIPAARVPHEAMDANKLASRRRRNDRDS